MSKRPQSPADPLSAEAVMIKPLGEKKRCLTLGELGKIADERYGGMLPNNAEGMRHLRAMLCFSLNNRMERVITQRAPWLHPIRALMLCEAVTKMGYQKRRLRPDTIAKRLNVTAEERDRLGLRTIGAVDLDREARQERRKERARDKKRKQRAEQGATPRSQSLATQAPWRKLRISRSTYFERRKKGEIGTPVRTVSSAKMGGKIGEACDTFVRKSGRDRTVSSAIREFRLPKVISKRTLSESASSSVPNQGATPQPASLPPSRADGSQAAALELPKLSSPHRAANAVKEVTMTDAERLEKIERLYEERRAVEKEAERLFFEEHGRTDDALHKRWLDLTAAIDALGGFDAVTVH
jgi:hypothetical protein